MKFARNTCLVLMACGGGKSGPPQHLPPPTAGATDPGETPALGSDGTSDDTPAATSSGSVIARRLAPAPDVCPDKIARGTWKPAKAPPALGGATGWGRHAMWDGKHVLWIDGAGSGARYDPCRDAWQPSTPPGLPPRHQGVGLWTGDVLVFPVYNTVGLATGEVRIYDPGRDAWRATTEPSPWAEPVQGRRPISVTQRGVRLVFDEEVQAGKVNFASGTAYDANADARAPLPQGSAPSTRIASTIAWDGRAFAVWSGMSAADAPLGDGAILDLGASTWAWTPIPTQDAPAPRTSAAAGWVAGKLVVWSGIQQRRDAQHACMRDGAVFDPLTRRWRGITATGAPTPRRLSRALETRGRLVIYEGITCGTGSDQFVQDIAIYDPGKDRWQIVVDVMAGKRAAVGLESPVVLPDGRVFFGARDSSTFAVLDPTAGTMSTIALPKQLAGRVGMAHAVAGSRLLVWGGGRILEPGGGCDGPRLPTDPQCDPVPPTMTNEPDAYVYGL